MKKSFIHPYMPNSVPAIKQQMLDALGIDKVEDLYKKNIGDELRFTGTMDLPEPIVGEHDLKRHVMDILAQNTTCEEYDSFLGAGCYHHYVPAICDEINMRSEFLTGYCGDTYSDHGKMQAIFEYTSMMGDLLDMDVVSYTLYDSSQAIASALRMAQRVQVMDGYNERTQFLVPRTINPEVLSQLKNYCKPVAQIVLVECDSATGLMSLEDIKKKLGTGKVAALFFENPSYLGFFETQAQMISDLSHAAGAIVVVQPEVASLGIIEPPANYGADIVCGDIQPLGMHIQFGGGCAGFIASHYEEKFIQQFPTYMYGIARTENENEYGWGRALNYRCSHGARENANEYFGTETGLWCITAAVYLALMGPTGIWELGKNILQKCNYAIHRLKNVPFIQVNPLNTQNFQEFLVNFDRSGKTVAQVNKALLDHKIFGGKDVSSDFPAFGQSALYCVTETTSCAQIDRLAETLSRIMEGQ